MKKEVSPEDIIGEKMGQPPYSSAAASIRILRLAIWNGCAMNLSFALYHSSGCFAFFLRYRA
jgi:hypothetical protein